MAAVKISPLEQMLTEIVEAAENDPQMKEVAKVNGSSIERLVRQCYALLRQEAERKIKLEPAAYPRERVRRALQGFEAAIPEIHKVLTERLVDSVAELARQHVRRLLEDALNDLRDDILDTATQEAASGDQLSASVKEPAEGQSAPGMNDSHGALEQRVKLPASQVGSSSEPVAGRPSAPPPTSEVANQEVNKPSAAHPTTPEHLAPAEDELFQGSVKLIVNARAGVTPMMQFMSQLFNTPELRVQQVVGTGYSTTVWLVLRRPMPLKQALSRISHVGKVTARQSRAPEGADPALDVELAS